MPLLSNVPSRRLAIPAALAVFGAAAYLASRFDTFIGDRGGLAGFQAVDSPWLAGAARGVTTLGDPLVAALSILGLAAALLLLRRRRDALVALLVFIPEGVQLAVKELVSRPRPEFSLLESAPTNPSFPSGHATHAILFFGCVAVLLAGLVRPWWLARLVQVLLWLTVLAVGASRVYLGLHWPSDVLGAYLLGGTSLVVLLGLRKSGATMSVNRFFPPFSRCYSGPDSAAREPVEGEAE